MQEIQATNQATPLGVIFLFLKYKKVVSLALRLFKFICSLLKNSSERRMSFCESEIN
jgi:hypothetical protein